MEGKIWLTPLTTRTAGDSVKPEVKRSATPGNDIGKYVQACETGDSRFAFRSIELEIPNAGTSV
jgi:hypothetical protein